MSVFGYIWEFIKICIAGAILYFVIVSALLVIALLGTPT